MNTIPKLEAKVAKGAERAGAGSRAEADRVAAGI